MRARPSATCGSGVILESFASRESKKACRYMTRVRITSGREVENVTHGNANVSEDKASCGLFWAVVKETLRFFFLIFYDGN